MNAQSFCLFWGEASIQSTAHFCCRVKGGWNIGGGQDVDSRKRLKVIFVLGMRTKRKWDEMFGNRTGRPQEADIHDGRRNTLGLSTSRPNGFRINNNSKMSETNFIRTLTVFQFTVGLL